MSRRRGDIVALLVMAPWWASVLASVGVYVLMAYVAPILGGHHRLLGPVAREFASLAPILALAFLFLAPVSAFRRWRAGRLLDAQTGLDSIRAMSWQSFENLVAEAYRREGYGVEETGGGGADGGVDLIIRKKARTFLVQCKRWRVYRVGVREVRELLGVVMAERAAGGILITTSGFTVDALDFARRQPVELVDGPRLLRLVRLARNGPAPDLSTPCAPEKPRDASTSGCPNCGRHMVMRTSKRGSTAGSRFWGCSAYPDCRGTRAL